MGQGVKNMNQVRTSRRLARVAIVVTAAALSGCMGGTSNPYMQTAHLPVVTQQQMTHDVAFSKDGTIPDSERQSLSEWFQSVGVNYGDRISLDDPHPGADIRRRQVGQVLAGYGLLLREESPVSGSTLAPGTARVVVLRAKASVPGCPDWSRASNPEFDASTMSNFGCATASNMAAMVVDANDLVSGREHTGTDAITTVTAIETYRNKAGKATNKVTNSAGSVAGSGGGGGGGGN
jgi:pilus assembly protein CpaD